MIATFQPKMDSDVFPHILKHVGWRGKWRKLWLMDEKDMFPGQHAYEAIDGPFWQWVPEEDLIDVVDSE